ncbi:MAG: hypothetical protein NTW87_01840 [Planctomycetota bacterium]|nr:hypothetical protein [Planctomycetota bacterium]
MASPEPQNRNPLVAAHPRAFRLCAWLRNAMTMCFWGVLLALVLLAMAFAMGFALAGAMRLNSPAWFVYAARGTMAAAVCLLLLSSAGAVATLLLRTAIIALFFARYSLAQMLTVSLLLGAGGTLTVVMPGALKIIPITGLVILVLVIMEYIANQDPGGANITPGFIRAALHRQRKRNDEAERR